MRLNCNYTQGRQSTNRDKVHRMQGNHDQNDICDDSEDRNYDISADMWRIMEDSLATAAQHFTFDSTWSSSLITESILTTFGLKDLLGRVDM